MEFWSIDLHNSLSSSRVMGGQTTSSNQSALESIQNTPAIPQTSDPKSSGEQSSFSSSRDEDNLSTFSHQYHKALAAYKSYSSHKEESVTQQSGIVTAEAKTRDPQDNEDTQNSDPAASKGVDGETLSDEEQQEVQQMQERDTEVRTHEQQHKAAGGSYASAPSYSYEKGPDGKRYVVDGEVSIDISKEEDPQKTIEKMQTVRRAALAPSQPSTADRQTASEAQRLENEARMELSQDKLQSEDNSSDLETLTEAGYGSNSQNYVSQRTLTNDHVG